MEIETLVVNNFRILNNLVLDFNADTNILVGNNGSGKSTIINALNAVITGRIGGVGLEHVLTIDDFNADVRSAFRTSNRKSMPSILIEVYFKNDDTLAKYKGTNNSLTRDCPGIRLTVDFNPEFEQEFKEKTMAAEDTKSGNLEIPIEYYHVQRYYFSGYPVMQQSNPFKTYFVDGTTNGYSKYVGRYVQQSITSLLKTSDQIHLRSAYESMKNLLRKNEALKTVDVSNVDGLKNVPHAISVDVRQSRPDEWLDAITLNVDGIPYSAVGLGTQRTVQMALMVGADSEKSGVLLFEEPENNLSYPNMNKLVHLIEQSDNRQKFITTHSSFVANKLGLKNLIVCNHGEASKLSNVQDKNLKYFQKLPGYQTLRVLLSETPVLVEGPTDELIFDKAYVIKFGHMPIEDGVDVIVVDSLAFKRYLDIAKLIGKAVIVITDNDGNQCKFESRYADYKDDPLFTFFTEENWALETIEPSFIRANETGVGIQNLWKLCRTRKPVPDVFDTDKRNELNDYMTEHKSEWAWRVFDSELEFSFPTYIEKAVEACKTRQ